MGRVCLGAADVADGVGGGQADAGGEIVDRLDQLALLLVVLAADAVGQDAGRVELDGLFTIGQGGGIIFQAHRDRCPRGIGLRVTRCQLHDGREVGPRGLEIGLGRSSQGIRRRAGAVAEDAGADEQRVAVLRVERQHVVQVEQGLVEHAQGRQQPGPGQVPLGFVRFEFDGRGGVFQRPVGFPQDVEGPGPGHDRIRPPRPLPDGLVEVLQGLLLVSGHAVADAAGQVGLGKLGSELDLPGIVGDGQVDFSLAAVDPCPPGIELARPGMEPDLLRNLVERVRSFAEVGLGLAAATGLHHAIQARRRAAPDRATSRPAFCQRICRENAIML